MKKIKTILKAFVIIALPPVLMILGSFAVSPVAEMCFGGISHPLMAFPAMIMMLPWGLLFFFIFFFGVGTMRTAFGIPTIPLIAPIPSVVIYAHGNGGFSASSGKGRGGGMILAIIKFILAIPIAVIVWIIVSIIILFNKKMETRMNAAFEKFISGFKKWYKWAALFFVVFPIIVIGFNHIENTIYSPKNIELNVTQFEYTQQDKYKPIEYFELSYTINPNGADITEIKGEWLFTNKNTGKTHALEANTFVPFDWHWENEDKNTPHNFNTTISIPMDSEEYANIFSGDINDIEIKCKINSISFDSNIPILGDFLFPTIDNEYKDGYEIMVKP